MRSNLMREKIARWLLLLQVQALITAVSWTIATPGHAQQAAFSAPETASPAANQFRGVDRCRDCHRSASAERVQAGVTDFVLLNESVVWVADLHSQAFTLIDPSKSSLGKQICDKLGIEDIHESRACLSCHSDWRPGLDKPPTYERGVACESCHGPSRGWEPDHSEAVWRAMPVAEKEDRGMVDVRNPIRRAEQCFGCHIGNAAEGKVVTHAMYAAGHPPLPGIEIESFAAQTPRHWRYLEEKIADAKAKRPDAAATDEPFAHFDAFVRENHKYLNLNAGDAVAQIAAHKHRAAAVILGGAIALREYAELMRDLARQEGAEQHRWPELAVFDCRACHHDLQLPGWRQERRLGSVPGRPMLLDWPVALVPAAIHHATGDAANYESQLAVFQEKLSAVQAELQRTPFGGPSHVESACTELADWLDSAVIAPALARPFESRAVTESFKLLCQLGSEETHDFDSARQIAWALRILSCGIAKDEVRNTIQQLLEPLAQELRLDLPNGPAQQCTPISSIDQSRQLTPLAAELPASLAAPYQYDPEQFRRQMQELQALLSGTSTSPK